MGGSKYCTVLYYYIKIHTFLFCIPGPNAFHVLMNSARWLLAPSLPSRISEVTKWKQNFFVKIPSTFSRGDTHMVIRWSCTCGRNLCDGFGWYLVVHTVDGHHHFLRNRSNKVPGSLEHFTGYNVLEASNHQKCKRKNLSGFTLHEISNRLFPSLQGTNWERSGWKVWKYTYRY